MPLDRGCRSAVEDEVNSWFDTPQPEDDYDGYDAGSDGGFYGEPNSEGFPGDSNSFGPTIPSAYIDPVQEMIYQDYQRYQNNREFDGIQRTLDAAGLVPVFGIAADLVNAGISAARGRWKDAAMSLGAAVPIVGMAAGLYRLGKGGLKGAKGARGAQSIINRVMKANPRTTRGGGKGVQIQLRSGRVLDITKSRVKEFVPTARNPGSGMGRVRFRPGSGGFKRPPTRRDLELLNHFSR